MMKLIWTLFFFITQTASATIWITIADPQSNKIGVVGASSGNIGNKRTMLAVDNKGIAVVGAWYLGRKTGHLRKLVEDTTLSAAEVADEFSALINRGRKRRVSFVNARFENAARPGGGCSKKNQYCGAYEAQDFTVMGGGLVGEEVILAAKNTLHDPAVHKLPIECQLYLGMKAIFDAGGELKYFNRLSYMVDDVTLDNDVTHELYFRQREEATLLQQFKETLSSSGIQCR